jgi:hypothetical protein
MLKSRIEQRYEKHDCQRICQGDLLRGFKFRAIRGTDAKVVEIGFPFIVILSQDCDLEQGVPPPTSPATGSLPVLSQYLHNILFIPAFPAEIAREGTHLKDLFFITQKRIDGDLWRPITQNGNDRYHFLTGNIDLQIPNLLLDFKAYYTIPQEDMLIQYRGSYLATINELFRERLSQRFSNYLSRIGLPEFFVSFVFSGSIGIKSLKEFPFKERAAMMCLREEVEQQTVGLRCPKHKGDSHATIKIVYASSPTVKATVMESCCDEYSNLISSKLSGPEPALS